jgi:hypothetical protein
VKEYDEIRHVLNQLAETARAEAATGFDPSGLGCLADVDVDVEALRIDGTTGSGTGLSGDSLAEYATTVSDLSDHSDQSAFTGQPGMSDANKVQGLKLIFQDRFKDHTLQFVLKENGGNVERAFDELLTRDVLEKEGSLPKGIDGFLEPDREGRSRKGKAGRTKKQNPKGQKLTINYKAVSPAINDGELEGAKDFVQSPRAKRSPVMLSPLTPKLTTLSPPPPPAAAAASPSPTLTDFNAAHLRAAAASLRRMGPLGRQGAAVYAERAREETRALAARASLEAEARVARQSSDSSVDLHGVFVLDGVRIAKERVWAWWHGLGGEGSSRAAAAKKKGFTIVTGVGKHSVNGVSRLRQAVGAYLRNDGWKVETLTGSFYVTGRV